MRSLWLVSRHLFRLSNALLDVALLALGVNTSILFLPAEYSGHVALVVLDLSWSIVCGRPFMMGIDTKLSVSKLIKSRMWFFMTSHPGEATLIYQK